MKVEELLESVTPAERAAAKEEIKRKFIKLFSIKNGVFDNTGYEPFEGEVWEKFSGAFWSQIVEPGWMPKALESKFKPTDFDAMDQMSDLQLELQHEVAKELKIPKDLIEV